MIYVYGGEGNVMLVGVNDFGSGIPSPFVATAPRQPMEPHLTMETGDVEASKRKSLLAAFDANGTVIRFENPQAAHRMLRLLEIAFDAAMDGPWGDIDDDERTLQ